MTVGIILAAGRSTRMGRPKAFLTCDAAGTTFLAQLMGAARGGGAEHVIVVGRPEDARLAEYARAAGAEFVANPHADDGQLSSFLAGLAAAELLGADAVLMMPVDVPLVSARVVAQLIGSARSSATAIVRPVFQGVRGHPVLFKRAVFEELRAADPGTGARAVVRAYPERVLDVAVEEEGVTLDVDTPTDYARIFGRQL